MRRVCHGAVVYVHLSQPVLEFVPLSDDFAALRNAARKTKLSLGLIPCV